MNAKERAIEAARAMTPRDCMDTLNEAEVNIVWRMQAAAMLRFAAGTHRHCPHACSPPCPASVAAKLDERIAESLGERRPA